MALLARVAGEALERWLLVAVIICIAVLAVGTPQGIDVTWDRSLFRRIHGFAVGATGWRWWQGQEVTPGRVAGRMGTLVEIATVVLVLAREAGPKPLQGVVLTVVMLLLVIGVASLARRWVEVPGQALSRRLARRPVAPVAAAAG